MKNYIPSPQHWKEMFNQYDFYNTKDRVPINDVKIDRSLFAFNNPVNRNRVLDMLLNFDHEAWMPITVNEGHYLLDGQHRLELAKQLGLEYIDVVIMRNEKIQQIK